LESACEALHRHVETADGVFFMQMQADTFAGTAFAGADMLRESFGAGFAGCPVGQAVSRGQVLRIDCEADARHWPALARICAAAGVRSMVVVPGRHEDREFGAFVLYSTTKDLLSTDLDLLALVGRRTAAQLSATVDLDGAQSTVSQLQQALQSRAVIEQAKGALMVLHGVDADSAFAILRERSQHSNTKLRAVAGAVLRESTGRVLTDASHHGAGK
ncbi:MAG: hypothetical protein CSB46_11310, partial [Micrococcales bacterium]